MPRLALFVLAMTTTLFGCADLPADPEQSELAPAPVATAELAPELDFELPLDPAQVVYSDGLLPPQGLFDWYAESGYFQSAEGQPSAMLTADTVVWDQPGELVANGVEWTLYVTAEGSPVSLDPAEHVDHCLVRRVLEGLTLADPYDYQFLGQVEVDGSTVIWDGGLGMVEAHTQDLCYSTLTLGCSMLPNTTDDTLLISAVFTGVTNPVINGTGQEVEVEIEEHDSLVFYYLPE